MRRVRLSGFQGFLLLWSGQFVSLIGTSMTRFAITIWAYQETGSATALALVGFFSFGPTVLLSPLAGALVDRWPRRSVLIISDLGAGCATLLLLLLALSGKLELWHLYLAGAIAGAFESFQFPAFSAAITMMVDKRHFARASAMRGVAESASTIIAPILAGILLGSLRLSGILLLDAITFALAMGTLTFIHIPEPVKSAADREPQSSLRREVLYGFSYIWERPSLLGMQLIFTMANLLTTVSLVLLAPMILGMTGSDELALGTVQTALGAGGLVGGIMLSLWGGPRGKVHGVPMGMIGSGLLGQLLIGIGDGLWMWTAGAFLNMFFVPLINSSNQAIWQAKVPPTVQGRVFSVRRLLAQVTAPLAMLLAGPLADQVFEPAMMPGGSLAPWLGPMFGTAPGSGIRVIFVLTGFLAMMVGMLGYAFPVVRDVELRIPDFEASGPPPEWAETGRDQKKQEPSAQSLAGD